MWDSIYKLYIASIVYKLHEKKNKTYYILYENIMQKIPKNIVPINFWEHFILKQ